MSLHDLTLCPLCGEEMEEVCEVCGDPFCGYCFWRHCDEEAGEYDPRSFYGDTW